MQNQPVKTSLGLKNQKKRLYIFYIKYQNLINIEIFNTFSKKKSILLITLFFHNFYIFISEYLFNILFIII